MWVGGTLGREGVGRRSQLGHPTTMDIASLLSEHVCRGPLVTNGACLSPEASVLPALGREKRGVCVCECVCVLEVGRGSVLCWPQ